MSTHQNNKTLHFIIYSSYPNYSGGRENWLYNIIPFLLQAGFKVKVLSYKNSNKPIFYHLNITKQFQIIQFPLITSIPLVGPLIMRKGLETIDWHLFNLYIFFYVLFHNPQDNLYLTLGPIQDSLGVTLAKTIKQSVKHISLVRGLHANVSAFARPFLSQYFYFIEKWTLTKSNLNIANGDDTQQYINSLHLDSRVIPNGVDYERFAVQPVKRPQEIDNDTTFYAVMVASLMPVKGIDDVLQAAKIIKEKNITDIKFLFVGKGNIQQWIHKTHDLNVADITSFVGQRADIPAYYRYASVCLTLNYGKNSGTESAVGGGVSMSFLEALASGTPVIAFNNQIYNSIVTHEENALLAEERQPETLVQSILKIKNNPLLAQKLGENAQQLSQQYDWHVIAERFIQEIGVV